MEDLRLFLKEQINEITYSDVEYDEELVESGILDSIAIVDLIVVLEEELNISVPNGDIIPDNFQTINSISTYLESKTA